MEKTISDSYRPLIEDEITNVMDCVSSLGDAVSDKRDTFDVPYHAKTEEDRKLNGEWCKLLDSFYEQVCEFAEKHDMKYLVS